MTVSYEHLLENSREALEKIFSRLPFEISNEAIEGVYDQSFTKISFNDANKNRLASWKNNLSAIQIDTILNFVNRMGVDFYSDELEPDCSKIYNLKVN